MFNSNERRAQSSFELIAIIGLILLLVLGGLSIVLYSTNNASSDNKAQMLESIGAVIESEINLAKDVQGEYYREFTIPYTIGGSQYEVYLSSPAEVTLKMESATHVIFLSENATGIINRGKNIIRKAGGKIYFN